MDTFARIYAFMLKYHRSSHQVESHQGHQNANGFHVFCILVVLLERWFGRDKRIFYSFVGNKIHNNDGVINYWGHACHFNIMNSVAAQTLLICLYKYRNDTQVMWILSGMVAWLVFTLPTIMFDESDYWHTLHDALMTFRTCIRA